MCNCFHGRAALSSLFLLASSSNISIKNPLIHLRDERNSRGTTLVSSVAKLHKPTFLLLRGNGKNPSCPTMCNTFSAGSSRVIFSQRLVSGYTNPGLSLTRRYMHPWVTYSLFLSFCKANN